MHRCLGQGLRLGARLRQDTQDLAVAIRLCSHHGEEVGGTELPALGAVFWHNVARLPRVPALRLTLVAVAAAGKLPGTRAEETFFPKGLARCTPLQNLLAPPDKRARASDAIFQRSRAS